MPRVLVLHCMIYVAFLSNRQPHTNKKDNLLFIEKYKKLYKLKYQFSLLIISIY